MMEKMSEGRPGRVSIGTTSRGIGPCYEDKIARRGIRIADLLDPDFFRAHYDSLMEEKVAIAKALGIDEELDLAAHPRRVRGLRRAHTADGLRHRAAAQPGHPRRQDASCSKARRAPCSISTTAPIRS